jgi:amino acid adenylation domain-containing protein
MAENNFDMNSRAVLPAPLLDIQREVIFGEMLYPSSAIGLTGGTMELNGPLDVDRLIRVLNCHVKEVDAFNLAFRLKDGVLLQEPVEQSATSFLRFIDLATMDSPREESERMMRQELLAGFDTFGDLPLIRQFLFRLAPEKYLYAIISHHALIDGWGFSVWVETMASGYKGNKVNFPRYLDLTQKRSQKAQVGTSQRSIDYWLSRFPKAPKRHFKLTGSGIDVKHRQYTVDVGRRKKWKAFADLHNLSMASLATASLMLTIREFLGDPSPTIGTPLHNRTSPTQKSCIGMFASVLPVGLDIADGEGLLEVAARVSAEQRASFRHMNVTMSDLKKAWGSSQETREPLEITFSFEPHNYNVVFPSITARISAFPPIMQNRPVQLYWREYQENEPAIIDLCINPDFEGPDFSANFVDSALKRLDLAVSGRGGGALPLDHENKNSIDIVAQATLNDDPKEGTTNLWGMLCRTTEQFPDNIAVSDGAGQELTYRNLKNKALNLAQALHSQGVKSDQPVGIAVSRDCQLIVGILAILAAGGAYVPIDPDYPEDRQKFLIEDSGIKLLLVDDKTTELLSVSGDLEKIRVDLPVQVEKEAFNVAPIHPDQACYIIYTSGTTGTPKGCIVSHKNVVSLLRGAAREHGYRETDVWTMFHSFAFDFSVWEIWGALATGGEVVVVDGTTARDPEAFLELLRKRHVTILNQTPTAFQSLLSEVVYEAEKGIKPQLDLRRIIFGGEALNPSILKNWFSLFGTQAVITNMYGITETTVHVTQLDYGPTHTGMPSALGKPIPAWNFNLFDDAGNPITPDEIGEIFVGGAGVTRGYLNRPRLTAERFVPDPNSIGGARLYRAGDMARLDPQFGPVFVGRNDRQVKIRGFRIELGEIEAAFLGLSGVNEVAVKTLDASNGNIKQLVAWVVVNRGEEESENNLRALIAQKLPSHMIPNRIVFIKSFPKTINGKRDLSALRLPGASGETHEDEVDAKQAILAEIWTEVLGCPVKDDDSNFFNLGGDSILALKLLSRLRESGYSINISQLYKSPALADVAKSMYQTTNSHQNLASPKLMKRDEERFAMTATQVAMVYHGENEIGSGIFHDLFRFEIRRSFDPDSFQKTLDRAVGWASPLRTRFDLGHVDGMQQVVERTGRLNFTLNDLRGQNEVKPDLATMATSSEWQHDIDRAPLFKLQVDVIGDEKFYLSVGFHHAILDGWSFANLMAAILSDYLDIQKIIVSEDMGEMQAEASQQQRQALQTQSMVNYWKAIVSKLPALPTLSHDRNSFITCRKAVGAARAAAVRKMAQSVGIPLRTLMLAVHFKSLEDENFPLQPLKSPYVTGYVANIRPEIPGSAESLGMFLNTLPIIRPDCQSSNLNDWLRGLASVEAEFLENRFMPLPVVLSQVGGKPVFETAFNFVHFHNYNSGLGENVNVVENVDVFERTDFPLLTQFGVDPKSDEIDLLLVSNRKSDTQQLLEKTAKHYFKVIDIMLEQVDFGSRSECLTPASSNNWTRREERLRAIWQDVTQHQVPSPESDLYAHGADSLLVTRFVAVVKRETEIALRIRDFLENPTLRNVARRLDELEKTEGAARPKLKRRNVNSDNS